MTSGRWGKLPQVSAVRQSWQLERRAIQVIHQAMPFFNRNSPPTRNINLAHWSWKSASLIHFLEKIRGAISHYARPKDHHLLSPKKLIIYDTMKRVVPLMRHPSLIAWNLCDLWKWICIHRVFVNLCFLSFLNARVEILKCLNRKLCTCVGFHNIYVWRYITEQ